MLAGDCDRCSDLLLDRNWEPSDSDRIAGKIITHGRASGEQGHEMNEPEPDILAPLRTPQHPAPAAGITRHTRDAVMESAGAEITVFFSNLIAKHTLTAFEYLYLIAVLNRGLLQALSLAEREAPQ
jgi:hypothetical protein